jgi:thymidylate synthase
MMNIPTIRHTLADKLIRGEFQSPRGQRTLEVTFTAFDADLASIFGEVDWSYVQREIDWYVSQSRNVNDIPGGAPKIWQQCATKDGWINSNYGWMIYSDQNGLQYENARDELRRDPSSRRAVMIYTRPEMHYDWCDEGMTDFCCTNTVQYVIRAEATNPGMPLLHALVSMRSNDAVYGYKNDRAWQLKVLHDLAAELGVEPGRIVWCAGSLHVYERHFYLVDHFARTGEITVTKERYRETYPESEWSA